MSTFEIITQENPLLADFLRDFRRERHQYPELISNYRKTTRSAATTSN